MTVDTERRAGSRLVARVSDLSAGTRDVSANGFFLYANSKMEEGTEVELALILPPQLLGREVLSLLPSHNRTLRGERIELRSGRSDPQNGTSPRSYSLKGARIRPQAVLSWNPFPG